ncbi:glycosyltransferase family 4 protein [Geodermatophilus sp. DSM 44513]|uniref:glycosyltransferase family 4 protein n=1 Tax=Geodermatophilus sp. DSM 44513 TaxID=1528104 RepID=UPI001283DCC1|nr:glycosyltransferase family 4 protein [Geodermatophilus sp. DSM 44513]WNV76028.1 glycosyltransferase family 4 protein [Geodermatophilus sp. DSM 44513]
MSPETAPRVGYVLKVHPRFSETFVLTELLAHQVRGLHVHVFSLRAPCEGRFHEALARLRTPVTYLTSSWSRTEEFWDALRAARDRLPGLAAHAGELLDVDHRDAAQAVELALAVRASGITHLHAHFASVATTVARLAARLAGVTYSFTAHAKDVFHEEVVDAELRAKLADAADVVTVSDFNVAHLRRRFGPAAARVRRVYNGLDLPAFPWTPPTDRPPVVAAVGRLVEKKGFADLLHAVARLQDTGRDLSVVLVGTGQLAGELAALVRRLGLEGAVTMPGALTQDEVRRVVGGAAVLAAPCVVGADGNRDGLPTVVLEAMALGTPVVATPVTGIPEVVEHGRTGLLVPERDPAALAGALARLLDDAALRTRLATAARARVETDFDAAVQAARVAEGFAPATRPRPAVLEVAG